MIDKKWDNYESGYYEGLEEGKKLGYEEGYCDAVQTYEARLAKQWAEIQTLNARIDAIETLLLEDTIE